MNIYLPALIGGRGGACFIVGLAALLIAAAAPVAPRLVYDPAVFGEGACLAPDYAGVGCPKLESDEDAAPTAPSASGAIVAADERPAMLPPRLVANLSGLLESGPEVTHGRSAPRARQETPAARFCASPNRHRPDRSICPRPARRGRR
jgi:hypothetical protein